ncbi:MAG: dihydrodipicolinate synthase family protein [Anaerolineaceae bacterium]|nr:dihydrodipicolinate synthase family protein [Anaerolineaceae bacterium]
MTHRITGIFNILATPFDARQQVDLPSLRKLVNFQIDLGVYGLTILGVLGEAAKLTVDERKAVMETVIETVNGRIPIVVGTSHKDLHTCIDLSKSAVAAGAAGVMIAPPPMNNPSDDEIIALYSTVANSVDTAIVVQDFPPVNGVTMTPDMLAELAGQIPNARYLKLEDPPLMQKIRAIRERTDQYQIFGGLGGMFLLEELESGASGTMTGFAFSEILVAVYDLHQSGQADAAAAIFDHYLPLIRYENQPVINLTIRKELLRRRQAIANATPRDPFSPIDSGTHAEIDRILARVGIQDASKKIMFDKPMS